MIPKGALRALILSLNLFAAVAVRAEVPVLTFIGNSRWIGYGEAMVARKAYLVTAVNRLAEHCGFEPVASDGAEFQMLLYEIENAKRQQLFNESLLERRMQIAEKQLDVLLAEKDCVSLREECDRRRLTLEEYLIHAREFHELRSVPE